MPAIGTPKAAKGPAAAAASENMNIEPDRPLEPKSEPDFSEREEDYVPSDDAETSDDEVSDDDVETLEQSQSENGERDGDGEDGENDDGDDGIDVRNIITGKRTRRQVTRYIDPDHVRLLAADVPDEELNAAFHDENLSDDSSDEESGDDQEDYCDADMAFIAPDEDEDDEPSGSPRKKKRKTKPSN